MLTAPSWQSSVLESVPSGFLAHDWQLATGGRTFEVRNPATEEVIATVADCGTQDALSALDAAAAAAEQWALTSPRDRATLLHRLTDALTEHRERLARIITLEIGKTITEARGEVDYAAAYFRWYAEEAVRPHAWPPASGTPRRHRVAAPVREE
ncbi:Betaine-aldehyde dehydrogenase OS=Streptomyces alboniger OX=132473 GN=CP975_22020 PE=4 SV=1 [Streptomyces alboniger]